MPYIDTKTTVTVTPEQEKALFSALGKAIENIPGKTEQWLMLNLEGGKRMCFQGDAASPCAMVDVRIFGQTEHEACESMTKAICSLYEEILSVPAERIYVSYKGYDEWGWNHMNF